MFGIFSTALRHKIWFDLWGAKQRTLQAILTIMIGSFVVGAIFGGWGGIAEDTRSNFGPTRPPSISVRVSPPASAAVLETLRRDPQLAAVEGLMVAGIKWRPNRDTPWRRAQLQARADYTDQQLSLLLLESGAWPQGRRFAVERGFPISIGDEVELQIEGATAGLAGASGTHTARAAIGGVIYNLSQPSAALGADPTFYVSRALFAELTGQDRFVQIIATVPDYSAERAAAATATLQNTLREQGFDVQPGSVDNTKVANPNRAFFQDAVESVGLILQSIGIIAVVLGLLLVYNTVTAIVTQQIAQIGELKAIGATSRQILLLYFTLVFSYGLVALLISVPAGLLAANGLRQMLLMTLGLKAAPWMVLPAPILYQVAICLVAPLLVATIPVMQGARVTVREAISSYGLSGGGGWIDGLLARLRGLPRVVSLAFSNAFRNLGRIATTQFALAGAGLTFMAVICVRTSLIYTLSGILLQAYPYQIQLDLAQNATLPQVAQASELPGVAGVEGWRLQRGTLRRAGTPEQITDPAVNLAGVPLPSAAYQPVLLAGRTLQPGDTHVIVLHEWLARDAGVGVGDWVLVSIPDPSGARRWLSQERWQVVGVLLDVTMGGGALVPRETLFDATGRREVNRVQVLSSDGTEAGTAALATQLRSFYEARGLRVQLSDRVTVAQRSNGQLASLAAVLGLLVLVALIVALVGAISLNGMLSLSVLERRREIGVLRAIGATPGFVRSQFVLEGLLMGLLSWLLALLLSYPVAYLTAQGVAASLRLSVVFQYDWTGVWLWLLLASVIAIIASLSPAQQAIRTSVQESLAYE
ncbi:MAG: FtsX-like permease family protein [Roseiflexaceae bacterium]